MKKIISIFIMLIVFTNMVGYSYALGSENKYKNVFEQAESLMKYFENEYRKDEFPDYYSGIYYGIEEEELVVLINEFNDENINIIKKATNNPGIMVKSAKYSYKTLKEEMGLISKICLDLKDNKEISDVNLSHLLSTYAGVALDEQNNTLVIFLTDISQNNIDSFKKYISDFEGFRIEQTSKFIEQATYKPGRGVHSNTMGPSTMGYRNRLLDPDTGSYKRGFWIAGHGCYYTGVDVIYTDSSMSVVMGEVEIFLYNDGIDAAWVKLASQADDVSLILEHSGKSLSDNWYTTFIVNTPVYIDGNYCGEKNGLIKYSSFDDSSGFNDLCLANYTSYGGDSGAPIHYDHDDNDYWTIYGIHRGEVYHQWELKWYAGFTKHTNIVAEVTATVWQ